MVRGIGFSGSAQKSDRYSHEHKEKIKNDLPINDRKLNIQRDGCPDRLLFTVAYV